MNRRDFTLGTVTVLAAATFSSRVARAEVSEPTISREARALHRRAIVLDANLAPPAGYETNPPGWDASQVTSETVDALHTSGMTAIKLSIGGFNAPFEDTVAEIGA